MFCIASDLPELSLWAFVVRMVYARAHFCLSTMLASLSIGMEMTMEVKVQVQVTLFERFVVVV